MHSWCGIEAKVAQLRELCGSEHSDAQLEAVLKSESYDVSGSAEYLLDHAGETLPSPGLPSEMDRGGQRCEPSDQPKRRRQAFETGGVEQELHGELH
eukprot:2635423-Prymnesium_polylepis.1